MGELKIARQIVEKLQKSGHTTYFAGGWVRDYLMNHPSDDIDIATSASTDQVKALFPKTVPVGVAFGIIVVVEEGHAYEVATFRKDRAYEDGRRPTGVDPATPEEDAERRDFTINGLFYDPVTEKIYDYVEGQKDLKKGIIRAIGNPHERFLEDRLRMMRAVRYSTRFNFPVESDTLQAILAHSSSLLPAVAMERVWQEFKKMARFGHFNLSLVMLHQVGLLSTIFPALKDLSLEEIQGRLAPLEHFPAEAPPIAQVLELFPESSLEQLFNLCDYLKLPSADRLFVEYLHHGNTLLHMPQTWRDKLEPFEWAQFYANPSSETVLKIFAARLAPPEREKFLEFHHQKNQSLRQAILRIRSKEPVVKAGHLIQEGVSPGKHMGLLLKEAEKISINQGMEDRSKIIEQLKKSSLWP